MKRRSLLSALSVGLIGLVVSVPATSLARGDRDPIDVQIVDDRGREFRQYEVPVRGQARATTTRAYIEARPERNYAVRVRNNTGRRMGVVIAVDGRNIISGRKSELANDERMYILGPHESAVYEGWRTSKNRVNRFYFTDAEASYADAFGDRSAMGVIAVAAYPEKPQRRPQLAEPFSDGADRAIAPRSAGPGTGFGDSEWSPSRKVEFDPMRDPVAKSFVKYEWRESLCRKGIVDCERYRPRPPHNRFWPEDDGGFAPPPPGWPRR